MERPAWLGGPSDIRGSIYCAMKLETRLFERARSLVIRVTRIGRIVEFASIINAIKYDNYGEVETYRNFSPNLSSSHLVRSSSVSCRRLATYHRSIFLLLYSSLLRFVNFILLDHTTRLISSHDPSLLPLG